MDADKVLNPIFEKMDKMSEEERLEYLKSYGIKVIAKEEYNKNIAKMNETIVSIANILNQKYDVDYSLAYQSIGQANIPYLFMENPELFMSNSNENYATSLYIYIKNEMDYTVTDNLYLILK